MNVMFWVWLAVIVLSVIIEIATAELISVWFTAGAVVPFVLSAFDAVSYPWQIVIFVVLSGAFMIGLRPVAKKFLLRNCNEKTNLDRIIGQKYTLLQSTDFEHTGKVMVNGVEWTAVAQDNQSIEQGTVVEVVSTSGNKLVVKPVKD